MKYLTEQNIKDWAAQGVTVYEISEEDIVSIDKRYNPNPLISTTPLWTIKFKDGTVSERYDDTLQQAIAHSCKADIS